MAEELFIPKLGQTVEEVTLLNWLVKDGEKVEQGQEVLEVETDKAVFNVEAVESGYIHIGPYKAGQVVPVLEVVALIGEADDIFKKPIIVQAAAHKDEVSEKEFLHSKKNILREAKAQTKKGADDMPFISPRARKLADSKSVELRVVSPTGGGGVRIREIDIINYLSRSNNVSPIARKMAEDAGLDLRSVKPSGPRGEITRADVEFALARRLESFEINPSLRSPAFSVPDMEIADKQSLTGVRGIIADRMSASSHTTVRVTLFMDADVTKLVSLREKLKNENESDWGFAPGYNELFAKACACALRQFSYINARINGESIERLSKINIGIAVDSEKGLFVPVIRDVDLKDLKTISAELRQRIDEVRSSRINPDSLSGGTFTITNLGTYDIDGFTPVINLPEAAILGIGRIMSKPVVKEEKIVIRRIVTLSLAFDHRLIDGAPAAKFLQYIRQLIEEPDEKNLTSIL